MMYAVNVTIKVQNRLAKDSIILSLKKWSDYLYKENGLVLRCFLDKTDNEIDVFHVWESRAGVEKTQKQHSSKFWSEIQEMGGKVTRIYGPCELEMAKNFKDLNINFK